MSEKIQYAVVKVRLSKGDLMFSEALFFYDTLNEARAKLEAYLPGVEHGFRWSDWDEYEIHRYEDGVDCGRVE